ncbi:MAG: PQQ-dependent sugar dehydrogenase, partial [Gemmatimonadota bacterium]
MAARIARVARGSAFLVCVCLSAAPRSVTAQGRQWVGVPEVSVPDLTLLHTANEPNVLVRVVARGLSGASSFSFLPDGDVLVTEKQGRLRVIRDGVLDPTPVWEVPVRSGPYAGMSEVVLHPDFARNRLVYLTYPSAGESHIVLARGRYDGQQLEDVEVLFQTDGAPLSN